MTESDIGQGFIKGLTGHEPAYWAENVGSSLRMILDESKKDQKIDAERKFASAIICASTKSFLETENYKLERASIDRSRFRDAYEAKNTFYESCLATHALQAIGFDEHAVFPIKRNEFSKHVSALPPKEDADEAWFVATAQLRVTSPNWVRNDRARQWKGHDHQGRDRYFRIEDEEFWNHVGLDTIDTHIIDTMTVQWAFQGRPQHPKNCRVLRVLKFNNSVLAPPLSDDEIVAHVGQLGKVNDDQGELF
ncbi:hypothetical protein [Brevundimonas sp.]|uniref:hypothetical protein n=1 Tax=Brevundimonas sp. TaxID=1871086 RepID=UPI0025B832B0|nr:hypothetical protein [Brevundimonas sp.]